MDYAGIWGDMSDYEISRLLEDLKKMRNR
nr:hypothetical protein [Sulfurisphaera tokodaii]